MLSLITSCCREKGNEWPLGLWDANSLEGVNIFKGREARIAIKRKVGQYGKLRKMEVKPMMAEPANYSQRKKRLLLPDFNYPYPISKDIPKGGGVAGCLSVRQKYWVQLASLVLIHGLWYHKFSFYHYWSFGMLNMWIAFKYITSCNLQIHLRRNRPLF